MSAVKKPLPAADRPSDVSGKAGRTVQVARPATGKVNVSEMRARIMKRTSKTRAYLATR